MLSLNAEILKDVVQVDVVDLKVSNVESVLNFFASQERIQEKVTEFFKDLLLIF